MKPRRTFTPGMDPVLPPSKPEPAERAPRKQFSSAAVFRGFGWVLLTIGILSFGLGLGSALKGQSALGVIAGGSAMFWAAVMFGFAEALTRLAEISAAVRKQAGE